MNFGRILPQVLVNSAKRVIKGVNNIFYRYFPRIEVTEQDIFQVYLVLFQDALIGGLFREMIAGEQKTDQIIQPGDGILRSGRSLPLCMMRFTQQVY